MNTNEDDQLWLTEECPRCEGAGTIWNEIMRGYIMCIKCAGTGWYSFRLKGGKVDKRQRAVMRWI